MDFGCLDARCWGEGGREGGRDGGRELRLGWPYARARTHTHTHTHKCSHLVWVLAHVGHQVVGLGLMFDEVVLLVVGLGL